jgi:hypothetical protein
MKTTNVDIMETNVTTNILEQGSRVHSIEKKILGNKYELEVALEDKLYLETYYNHQPKNVAVNETPAKIKA